MVNINGPVVQVLGYGKGEIQICYTCDSLGNRSPLRGSSPHKSGMAWHTQLSEGMLNVLKLYRVYSSVFVRNKLSSGMR